MKILFFNEYTAVYGGTDKVVELEIQELSKRGIKVKLFRYNNIDFLNSTLLKKIDIITSTIRGKFLLNSFQKIIDEFTPDIIHFHNLYQLFRNPIWNLIDPHDAKIILHLHNYYPFCLNSFFYTQERICTRCFDKNNWKTGIILKCYNDSILQSAYVSLNRLKPISWIKASAKVTKFIGVSEFVAKKYVQLGLPEDKVSILQNAIEIPDHVSSYNGSYVLYLGNVRIQKGIELFCDVANILSEIKFVIVGDGFDFISVRDKYKNVNNITFTGYLKRNEKEKIIRGAKFLYFPTLCWESFGMTIIEAYSYGKPVLTTGMGGTNELVIHGKTGIINPSLDPISQAQSAKMLWNELEIKDIFFETCIKYSQEFSLKKHIDSLVSIYKSII
jgi:glycosyltransferase involved in cell wall biosynthesis